MNRISRTQLSLACVPAKKRLFSHHLKQSPKLNELKNLYIVCLLTVLPIVL